MGKTLIKQEEIVIRLGIYGAQPNVQRELAEKFLEVLQLRLGSRLAAMIPKRELDELPTDRIDESMMIRMLDRNAPEHREIVRDEIERTMADFQLEYERIMARDSA